MGIPSGEKRKIRWECGGGLFQKMRKRGCFSGSGGSGSICNVARGHLIDEILDILVGMTDGGMRKVAEDRLEEDEDVEDG